MGSKTENALKLRIYRSLKSFICLKWILKNLSTTLHTQFNYLTLPVCPFNFSENLVGLYTSKYFRGVYFSELDPGGGYVGMIFD